MADPAPVIRVFAMFPSEEHDVGWRWIHCLSISPVILSQLQFTTKPYKWIRYAIGVIIGARGNLSYDRHSHENITIIDYDRDLQFDPADLYYHVSEDERQRMFPIDYDMTATKVASSVPTSRRDDFRDLVGERDGNRCVLTGYRKFNSDGVHLVPHRKGDEYIQRFTEFRARDINKRDVVDEIDDVRNGILLHKVAHGNFGKDLAFLVTPNFALTTTDVHPDVPPDEKRCTAHLFELGYSEAFGDRTLHSGCLVRTPDLLDDWPPDILFDAVYARAILIHFKTDEIQDALKASNERLCRQEYKVINDDQAARNEKRKKQNTARDERAAKRANRHVDSGLDELDLLFLISSAMRYPKQPEAIREAEKKAEVERIRLEDKVKCWAKDVADNVLE